MDDKTLLRAMRIVTLIFTVLVTFYAIHSDASIFQMVENAYQVTLVSAFIPLACGVYWKRATNQGALCAIGAGVTVWITLSYIETLSAVTVGQLPMLLSVWVMGLQKLLVFTPQGAGLLASALGMLVGSLLPQWASHDPTAHQRLRQGAADQPVAQPRINTH
jgi:Na+/proline symporter